MALKIKKQRYITAVKKLIPTAIVVFAMLLQPYYAPVSALTTTEYTTVDFTQSELDTNWGTDRRAPTDGTTSSVSAFGHTTHWDKYAYESEVFTTETPTNLRFKDANNKPIACGGGTNINFITPTWDGVVDAVSYNYKVTLPNGSTYGPTNLGNVTSKSGAFGGVGTSTFSVQAVYANAQTSAWAEPCAITYETTAPTTPTLLSPVHTGYKNVNDFYFVWTDSVDTSPVTYEFQSSQNSTTVNGVLVNGVWNNILNGNSEQKNLTSSTIHSTGANGTWYWQVRAIDIAGNKSPWTPVWKMTIDMAKPVLGVTSPLNGSYVNTRNNNWKLDVKGSIADTNPNYAYVQFLTEQHGALDGKTIYGAFPANSVLTSFDTTAKVDGKYGLNIAVADMAGNVFNMAQSTGYIDFFIDNTKPTIVVNTANNAFNPAKISVTATDNMRLKIVTANIYNESNTTPVRLCSKNVSADNLTTYTLDTCSALGLSDGVYTIRTNAEDMTGTLSSTLSSTKFIVNNTVPSVSAEDFGVGGWTLASEGFTGVNVGFNIKDFQTVSGITVDLYDQNGKFITNTANPSFVSLINSEDWIQLSSPFVVSGTMNDTWCSGGPCWVAGAHTWTTANLPVKAVITVTGTDAGGNEVVKDAENTSFTQSSPSFADILPVAIAPTGDTPGNSEQNGIPLGSSTERPSLPPTASPTARRAVLANNPNLGNGSTEIEAPEVLSEDTSRVLAETTDNFANDVATNELTPVNEGNGWLWWLIPAGAMLAGFAFWLIASRMRRKDDN